VAVDMSTAVVSLRGWRLTVKGSCSQRLDYAPESHACTAIRELHL